MFNLNIFSMEDQNKKSKLSTEEQNLQQLWHDKELKQTTHIGWYFLAVVIAILLMASVVCIKPL